MNEFLSLKWDFTSDKSYLEKQVCSFVSNDSLRDSYVYQNLREKLCKPQSLVVRNNATNFIPGAKFCPKLSTKSALTQEQHEQCLNAIKLLKLNKPAYQLKQTEASNLEVYKSLNHKISEEHNLFNESVRSAWENEKKEITTLKNNVYKYASFLNRKKAERYLEYKRYYKEGDLINMNYNEDEMVTVEVNHMANLLELGTLARFSHPSLKVECRLSAQTLPPIQPIDKNSKLSVSKDGNIRELLKTHDFDIAISSSCLKRLFDNTDLKEKWTIPIVVESINIQRGKEMLTKKVVFIDKPFVKNNLDPIDLRCYSMKRLVRTNFCHYEAFKYENQEIELARTESQNDATDDEKTVEDETKAAFKWKKKTGDMDVIHHNVSYRLWKVQKHVNPSMKNPMKSNELKLLVRSKLDGCEFQDVQGQALVPVVIKPKVELQLEFGANNATKSELSREWTSLFFRPFSNLYRVRMHWKTAEVVNLEKCTIQKIANEANQLYQYKPYYGLGILNDILTKLSQLDSGNYLLSHLPKHGSFVALMKESESPTSFDLHSEYEQWKICNNIERNWTPIDLNYILPIHEAQNRLPGCFVPNAKRKAGYFNKKPGAKKKKLY